MSVSLLRGLAVCLVLASIQVRFSSQHETCHIQHCKTCSNPDPICSTCTSNTIANIASSSCIDCPDNCIENSCIKHPYDDTVSKCIQCKTRFFKTASSTCSACTGNCDLCSDGFKCITCSAGYTKDPGGVVKCTACPTNCMACIDNSQCVQCSDTYYLDTASGTCQSCPPGCKTCQNSATCMECNKVEPDNMLNNNTLRWDPENMQCSPCDANCMMCTTMGCMMCKPTHFAPMDKSACIAPSNCLAWSSGVGCTQCPLGFTISTVATRAATYQICTPCYAQSDSTCTPCTTASGGRYFDSGVCGHCPENCESCTSGTTCDTCKAGYYKSTANSVDSCLACDSNCLTCTTDATTCATCAAGKYKTAGDACADCDSSCATCSSDATTCDSCADGKYLTGSNTCADCTSPCTKCVTSATQCTGCPSTHYLTGTQCLSCGTEGQDSYSSADMCTGCSAAGTATTFAKHCHYAEDHCIATSYTDVSGTVNPDNYILTLTCTKWKGSTACDATCEECVGKADATKCSKCATGKLQQTGARPDGSFECVSTCEEVKDITMCGSQGCSEAACGDACDASCSGCAAPADSTQCLACATGKYQKAVTAGGVMECVDACTDVTEASLCNSQGCGAHDGSACTVCHANCAGCKAGGDATSCTACAVGKYQKALAVDGVFECVDDCTSVTESTLCMTDNCADFDSGTSACGAACHADCYGCVAAGDATQCHSCAANSYQKAPAADGVMECVTACTGVTDDSHCGAQNCAPHDGSTCTDCHASCVGCTVAADVTKCVVCAAGKYEKTAPSGGNVECVDTCSEVTDPTMCESQKCGPHDGTTCTDCDVSCDGCIASGSDMYCKACATGYFPKASAVDGTVWCTNACGDITDSGMCSSANCALAVCGASFACDASCDTCTGSANQCTACAAGKYQLTVASGPDATFACGDACTDVRDASLCASQDCMPAKCTAACHANCNGCKIGGDATQCTACATGKYQKFMAANGVMECVDACTDVTDARLCSDQLCGPHDGTSCTACHASCSGCIAPGLATACTDCAALKYKKTPLTNGALECVDSCSAVTDSSLCSSQNCADFSSGTCGAACHANCNGGCTVAADAKKCKLCAAGTYQKTPSVGWVMECVAACTGVTDKTMCSMQNCGPFSGGACTACHANCDGCKSGNNVKRCYACAAGKYQKAPASKGVMECVDSCTAVTDSTMCASQNCGPFESGACTACHASCVGCSVKNDATKCNACAAGTYTKAPAVTGEVECVAACTDITDASLCAMSGCGEAVCGATLDCSLLTESTHCDTYNCAELSGATCGAACDVSCAGGCTVSADATKCKSCATGLYQKAAAVSGAMECVAACTDVTDSDLCASQKCGPHDGSACTACDAACDGCTTAADSTKCLACATGKIQQGPAAAGVVTCADSCDPGGYLDSSGICQACGGSDGGSLPATFDSDTCNPTCAAYWEGNADLQAVHYRQQCVDCPSDCATCAFDDGTAASNTAVCSACDATHIAVGPQCVDLNCMTAVGLEMITSSTDCAKCGANGFLWETKCLKCPANCHTCDNTGACSQCAPGFVINAEDRCIPCMDLTATSCKACGDAATQTAQYHHADNQLCSACLTNCAVCEDATTCTECRAGYFKDDTSTPHTCTECQANCAVCASATECAQCSMGYHVEGDGTCTTCPTGCVNCAGPTVCMMCAPGKVWDPATNTCSKDLPPQCMKPHPANGCEMCGPGFYVSAPDACTPCTDANCMMCTEANQCTQCNFGYVESSPGVCTNCPPNCKVCVKMGFNVMCGMCEPTHCRTSIGMCLEKQQCNGCEVAANEISCSSCKPGLYRELCEECGITGCNVCVKTAPGSSGTYQCQSCIDGYYFVPDTKTCQLCHASCKRCSDATSCDECKAEYVPGFINGNQCFACTSPYCLECTGLNQCTTCQDKYYESAAGICSSCGAGCNDCVKEGNGKQCLSCASTYRLTSGYCQPCSDGNCQTCETDHTQCETCMAGYFLTAANTCKACDTDFAHCGSCTDGDWDEVIQVGECDQCAAGYYLQDGTELCLKNSLVIDKCDVVFDDDEQCDECNAGYFYQQDKKECRYLSCYVCDSDTGDCPLGKILAEHTVASYGCDGHCYKHTNGTRIQRYCGELCDRHGCQTSTDGLGNEVEECCCGGKDNCNGGVALHITLTVLLSALLMAMLAL